MVTNEIKAIITDIQASPKECEWVEIKQNNYNPQLIGEYISALSNGAAYMGQSKGYLVFGIKDETHEIVGTDYNPQNEKIGNQELQHNSPHASILLSIMILSSTGNELFFLLLIRQVILLLNLGAQHTQGLVLTKKHCLIILK